MRRAKILGALALLALNGCSARTTPIWIGVVSLSTSENDDLRGAQLAVDEANRAGGINGRLVRIAVANDSGLGELAVRAAKHFVADDRIVGVVGHMSSSAMIAATAVYDGKLAAVATMATSPALTGISPWVFRVPPSDSALGAREARLFIARGWTRLAMLYDNDGYGRGISALLASEFRALGGTIVQRNPFTDGLLDFDVYVRKLERLNPDAVVVFSGPQSGNAFVTAAFSRHLKAQIIGSDTWPSSLAQNAAAEGVLWPSLFPPSGANTAATRFRSAFTTRYGREPEALAALGYDAALAVLHAIREGGATRAGVRGALANPRVAVAGATGAIRFEHGDRVGSMGALLRVSHGQLVIDALWGDTTFRSPAVDAKPR
ncbi:MAG: ABC transporter substrate-binding protein [bacterium]